MKRVALISLLAGTSVLLLAASSASAQVVRQRIVSTSGVPHGDVANYRHSPYWRPGMPTGLNPSWVEFLRTEVADITSGADVVLHQGDQVEGGWGQDCDGRGVFGPVGTWAERVRALTLAGNIYYSRLKRFWGDRDVLFGMGDHEIGDLPPSGIVRPGRFKYRAHSYWNRVWQRHYGPSRYASRRGRVGIITFDPFMKTRSGIIARMAVPTWIGHVTRSLTGEATGSGGSSSNRKSQPSARTAEVGHRASCSETVTRCGADSHRWASTSFWPPNSTATRPTRGQG